MDDWAQPLLDVIKAHPDWAAAVMFITAFGESFAFVSLLFPGTTVLIAAGTLLSGGTLPYASILVSAILGAVLGDSVSYWLGRRFGGGIARIWPFTRHPDLLPRGIEFFERHGGKSVFIGRFFGPIRAVIPTRFRRTAWISASSARSRPVRSARPRAASRSTHGSPGRASPRA